MFGKFTSSIVLIFALLWFIVLLLAKYRYTVNVVRAMLTGPWRKTPVVGEKIENKVRNLAILITFELMQIFALILLFVACIMGWLKNRRDKHIRKWIRFSARWVILIPILEIAIFLWQKYRVPMSLDKTTSITWIAVTILLAFLHTLVFHAYIYMLKAAEPKIRKSFQEILKEQPRDEEMDPIIEKKKKPRHNILVLNVGNKAGDGASSRSKDSDKSRYKAGVGYTDRMGDK